MLIPPKHALKGITFTFLFLLSGWWWVHDDCISETLWKNDFIPELSFSQSVLVIISVCHCPQNIAAYNTCLLSHGFCGSGMWVWLIVWLWRGSLRLQWRICWGCSLLEAWLGLEGPLVTECPTMWQPASLRDSRVRGEDALGPLNLVSEVTHCQFCHIIFVSTKSSPLQWGRLLLLRQLSKDLEADLQTTTPCIWADSDCRIFEIFYVNSVRTGEGLVFYPVCKLPSWLATASWMLRKAGILLVRAQGLSGSGNGSSQMSAVSVPLLPECDSEGARDIPQAPHGISEAALNSASRRQALLCRVSSPALSSKGPTGCTVFQGCSPLDPLCEDNPEQGSQRL